MPTGYEDIENLKNQTNQLYDEQMKQQQNIINTGTEQAIAELERNKKKAEEEALKTNRALYTDYQKQINPYGVNAENLAAQGLSGSGLAETTKANYYNTYQNARAEATNNANNIKADFDAQIAIARQNGDLQLAQSAMQMYQQKINDLYNTYNLKFNQDQFAYQKEQDALSQSNWEKQYQQAVEQALWERQFNENQFDYTKNRDTISDNQWQQQFDYNKAINDRNYNYQLSRDAVADSQWQKEYDLSKKKVSSSSGGTGAAKKSDENSIIPESGSPNNNENNTVQKITINDVLRGLIETNGYQPLFNTGKLYDKYSGKYFNSTQEAIAYWSKQ